MKSIWTNMEESGEEFGQSTSTTEDQNFKIWQPLSTSSTENANETWNRLYTNPTHLHVEPIKAYERNQSDHYGALSFLGLDKEQEVPPTLPNQIPEDVSQFMSDQLVPRDYLMKQRKLTIQPSSVALYLQESPYYTLEDIGFFLEGVGGAKLPSVEFFSISVFSPRKECLMVTHITDLQPAGHTFIFRPVEPGLHVIVVNLGSRGENQIRGSPTHLIVSRNYSKPIGRPIVRFDTNGSEGVHRNLRPCGLAVDTATERVFIPDGNLCEVFVYSADGDCIGSFGSSGSGPGELKHPATIAMDSANRRLIVADKDNHRVCFFSLDGAYLSSFGGKGPMPPNLIHPWGVCVTKDGGLIGVADAHHRRVKIYDKNGIFLSTYGVYELRQISPRIEGQFPRGICFDNTGDNVFVSDYNLKTVDRFNVWSGKMQVIIGGVLGNPQGISVDGADNLLVSDSETHCIRVFTKEGILLHSVHETGDGPLDTPLHAAVMSSGYLVILDRQGLVCIC